jgi:hypothetical protein
MLRDREGRLSLPEERFKDLPAAYRENTASYC